MFLTIICIIIKRHYIRYIIICYHTLGPAPSSDSVLLARHWVPFESQHTFALFCVVGLIWSMHNAIFALSPALVVYLR